MNKKKKTQRKKTLPEVKTKMKKKKAVPPVKAEEEKTPLTPNLPPSVGEIITPRTRKAHQPDCACSPCKRKRAKTEADEKYKNEIIEEYKKNNPPAVMLDDSQNRADIIKHYKDNLPEDCFEVKFDADTLKELKEKSAKWMALFPNGSSEDRGNQIVNHALKLYLKTI